MVSTNIAETGVTIPDVTCCIDSGKHKEMRYVRLPRPFRPLLTHPRGSYDEKRQISRLIETFIARSNATQRRGRAGRVQEGICYHLFTRSRMENAVRFARSLNIRFADVFDADGRGALAGDAAAVTSGSSTPDQDHAPRRLHRRHFTQSARPSFGHQHCSRNPVARRGRLTSHLTRTDPDDQRAGQSPHSISGDHTTWPPFGQAPHGRPHGQIAHPRLHVWVPESGSHCCGTSRCVEALLRCSLPSHRLH